MGLFSFDSRGGGLDLFANYATEVSGSDDTSCTYYTCPVSGSDCEQFCRNRLLECRSGCYWRGEVQGSLTVIYFSAIFYYCTLNLVASYHFWTEMFIRFCHCVLFGLAASVRSVSSLLGDGHGAVLGTRRESAKTEMGASIQARRVPLPSLPVWQETRSVTRAQSG